MAAVPTTSTTLLRDIAQDAQHPRWGEFVARYRPMMEAFMRERFPSVEADDVIQETFAALCKVLPNYRYAPDEKGHFHNYLTGILRNKAMRMLRTEERQREIAGRAVSMKPPLDLESYREAVFEIALRQFLADGSVADRTKRIFERTAINGESPESVAAAFKMSRHAVDQAKSRAMARLREIVKQLENAAES
ncbi:MAG: sigma-70 family RNA polymerase sigma factor [Kiritimatiellae bacterium]|nr:sigma-70 family RNA polymerase sigma factor [Kiritimatiellia bacterium]MBQ3341855.1 sigma-70 family RNA polymerase sigma factor [Kiritimatiellia bacterium]MBQ6328562.1 sigma-70 family RNA polymerase sigma factor [Kiritimatiellia bacterium]